MGRGCRSSLSQSKDQRLEGMEGEGAEHRPATNTFRAAILYAGILASLLGRKLSSVPLPEGTYMWFRKSPELNVSSYSLCLVSLWGPAAGEGGKEADGRASRTVILGIRADGWLCPRFAQPNGDRYVSSGNRVPSLYRLIRRVISKTTGYSHWSLSKESLQRD